MNQFKIRASAAGLLMTNARSKSEILSETAKSYIKGWVLEQLLDLPVNEFSSIYTNKGNAVEKDAIDFISTQKYFGQFMVPNVTRYEDEFMTGTPDAILEDHIFDCKASWNAKTFPFFDTELKEKNYFWQGQVYMHLTGKKKHVVYYTLMDTPEELIDSAAYKKARELGFGEPTEDVYHEVKDRMIFSHIDPELRIKAFEIDYSKECIIDLIERVKAARQYIEELCQTVQKGSLSQQ